MKSKKQLTVNWIYTVTVRQYTSEIRTDVKIDCYVNKAGVLHMFTIHEK